MSTYRDRVFPPALGSSPVLGFARTGGSPRTGGAAIGSARATVLRNMAARERRSHLTAPRVPTVGIDIGGTKVMAGAVGRAERVCVVMVSTPRGTNGRVAQAARPAMLADVDGYRERSGLEGQVIGVAGHHRAGRP